MTAEIASFVEHFGLFATWTGLAMALFAGLWMLRHRAGQRQTRRPATPKLAVRIAPDRSCRAAHSARA